MTVKCQGFLLARLPVCLRTYIQDDFKRLCSYLRAHVDDINVDDMFDQTLANLAQDIDEKTKLELNYFIQSVLHQKGDVDKITPCRELLITLLTIGYILSEQNDYLDDVDPDCCVWFFVAFLNDKPYGGTFAFYSTKHPDCLVIQGMCKFLVPSLAIHLKHGKLPYLNGIILPTIELLGRKLGCKTIQVIPLERQSRILTRFYGFTVKKLPIIRPYLRLRDSQTVALEKKL